jgi:hypothetical protein
MTDMRPEVVDRLLVGGLVGPPLFVAVSFIEGATRAGYDPIRHPISLLSLGDGGWVQTANFVVLGALTIGFAVGLRAALPRLARPSRAGPALIGLIGIGHVGAGLFATDPGGGYPPGVQAVGTTGTLHDLASLIVFISLPAAALVFARWDTVGGARRWAAYSFMTGVAFALGFVVLLVALNASTDLARLGGLIQRVVVLIGWTWLALLARRIRTELRAAR